MPTLNSWPKWPEFEGAGIRLRITDGMFIGSTGRDAKGRVWQLATSLAFGLLAAGCASTDQVTQGGRRIPIVRGAATDLKIDKLWVRQTDQGFELRGYLLLSPGAPQDAPGPVDVTLRDLNGEILERAHVPISQWRRQPRFRSRLASFLFIITRLPGITGRIEVSPHPETHPG